MGKHLWIHTYQRWRKYDRRIGNHRSGAGRHTFRDFFVVLGGGADELVTNHRANEGFRGNNGHDEYGVVRDCPNDG